MYVLYSFLCAFGEPASDVLNFMLAPRQWADCIMGNYVSYNIYMIKSNLPWSLSGSRVKLGFLVGLEKIYWKLLDTGKPASHTYNFSRRTTEKFIKLSLTQNIYSCTHACQESKYNSPMVTISTNIELNEKPSD